MTLNFGDEKVTKLYYKDKDVSGSQMLEAGTIVYKGRLGANIHLKSVATHWENISKLIFVSFGTNGAKYDTFTYSVEDITAGMTTTGYYPFKVVRTTLANGSFAVSVTNGQSTEPGTVEVVVA